MKLYFKMINGLKKRLNACVFILVCLAVAAVTALMSCALYFVRTVSVNATYYFVGEEMRPDMAVSAAAVPLVNGGAQYVYESEASSYLIHACYASEEDALSVLDHLSDSRKNARVFMRARQRVTVWANERQSKRLSECVSYARYYEAQLYSLANMLDSAKITQAEASILLGQINCAAKAFCKYKPTESVGKTEKLLNALLYAAYKFDNAGAVYSREVRNAQISVALALVEL